MSADRIDRPAMAQARGRNRRASGVKRQEARRRVTFIYGKGRFPTGQQRASELVFAGLQSRGWQARAITTPLLDRTQDRRARQLLALAPLLARAWVKGFGALRSDGVSHIGLGQTPFALVRDGIPLVVASLVRLDARAAVSLNGSLFMRWSRRSVQAQMLRHIVGAARYVTVVGPGQQEQMVKLGIPPEKVVWIDNACELAPLMDSACVRKHGDAETQPLRVLYLSNLLETKGYPAFVRAIDMLAARSDVRVDATLCGPIVRMDDDILFASTEHVRSWLESQIRHINGSSRVRLRRIEGAYGADKEALFREAHVFVLPTRYPVEAQPLTILEALASGCTVVTTRVGEIPSTVSEETALFLDDTEPETIAQAIADLYRDPERRTRLALNGLALFRERFSYEQHMDRWEQILMELADRGC
jgi:glycosyltransferase involved in cell wall biosynthesis